MIFKCLMMDVAAITPTDERATQALSPPLIPTTGDQAQEGLQGQEDDEAQEGHQAQGREEGARPSPPVSCLSVSLGLSCSVVRVCTYPIHINPTTHIRRRPSPRRPRRRPPRRRPRPRRRPPPRSERPARSLFRRRGGVSLGGVRRGRGRGPLSRLSPSGRLAWSVSLQDENHTHITHNRDFIQSPPTEWSRLVAVVTSSSHHTFHPHTGAGVVLFQICVYTCSTLTSRAQDETKSAIKTKHGWAFGDAMSWPGCRCVAKRGQGKRRGDTSEDANPRIKTTKTRRHRQGARAPQPT